MNHLRTEQIEELRQKLLQLQIELQQVLSGIRESSKPIQLDEPIGRLSRMDALQGQEIAKAQRIRLEAQQNLISAALNRIQLGNFGCCIVCEEPISFTRLRIKPEATMCSDCQKRSEH